MRPVCVQRANMRVFVTFLLSVLGASLVEGRNVSICEVQEALISLNGTQVLTSDLVAKIVCYVELASGLNTSAVTRLDRKNAGKHSPESSDSSEESLEVSLEVLYGLFQLSNQLACSDGVTPSINICSISCNNLIDDNLSDDLQCVSKVAKTLTKKGFRAEFFEKLKQWFMNIYRKCGNKTSAHLAVCV